MSYPSFGPASPQPLFQDNWRYCNNCHVLFYDGYPNKGVCPAGGGHVAIGDNFDIPYDPSPVR